MIMSGGKCPSFAVVVLSGAGVIPVPLPCRDGRLVPLEPVLEEVEDGELVSRHDVRVRLRLHLAPDGREGSLQNLADGRILRAIGALPCDLKGL